MIALSTSDNVWNPITHFDEWYAYDEFEKHYCTCGYLARMAHTVPAFSDELNEQIIENAIDDIVKYNILGIVTDGKVNYIKVTGEPLKSATKSLD